MVWKGGLFGGWAPAPGYRWVNPKSHSDFRVERIPQAEIDLNAASVQLKLADAAINRKDWQAAIAALNQAPMGTANDWFVRNRLARAWNDWAIEAYNNKDWGAALARMREAAKYSSDSWVTRNLDIAQKQFDFYEQQRRQMKTQQEQREAEARAAEHIRALVRQNSTAAVAVAPPVGPEPVFLANGSALPALPNNGTASALEQAYSAKATSQRKQPSFSSTGMSQWDTAGIKVAVPPVAVGDANGTPVIPPKLKANPEAWAKYQQMQAHQQQLQTQYHDLEDKLQAVRQQQAAGQGDPAALAIRGAQIKDQLTATNSAIQKDTIQMTDLSVSFEEAAVPPSKAAAPANTTQPGRSHVTPPSPR